MSGFMSLSNLVNINTMASAEARAACVSDIAILVKSNAINTVAKEGR